MKLAKSSPHRLSDVPKISHPNPNPNHNPNSTPYQAVLAGVHAEGPIVSDLGGLPMGEILNPNPNPNHNHNPNTNLNPNPLDGPNQVRER